ncbi:MAG: bifunctional demethylmenaquinone methyltransferase/2-methoxy-6-polyprenyl-1,4-benzoquinol methylase UbiE [Chlamydiae bacterium CG10_big_fil_rev_8_21_14_0_10_35_9]|nr:MAG: bifunctional demethylmenaquinone methyltransferase/2-methoxy-6-polyprenyl-1,4-benzoquinol methylase UbiE [Chlamydiae bacterium CG10_big_fil_rev_8_21_14_0_10_35_9]
MTQQETFKKEKSYQIFDQIYLQYDLINRILSFGSDLRWRKKLIDFLPDKENLSVLDIATGSGDQIVCLLNQKKTFERIIGIDLSEKMLEIARKKTQHFPYVQIEKGDAQNIPFDSNSFDCLTCSFGIRNVGNLSKTLEEMHRVLKPKGRAIILEFSLPKSRIFKILHLFYLRKILPVIGGIISKNRPAYTYLNETIESFPYGSDFSNHLKKANFKNVHFKTLSFGALTAYIAEK